MDHRVEIVISLMKNNLHQDLTLSEMGQAVNLSTSRLQHLFKAETRMTPGQYLRFLRIEKAKEMLGTTLMSVRQLRTRVGFKDRSHFEREFKKVYGLTPVQYRVAAFSSREGGKLI